MDFLFSAYLAAFSLGAIHAIEVDHVVAVSVFAGLKPRMKAAVNYGARWAIGHAAIVVVVGSILAWFNVKVPSSLMGAGEMLVGIALVALGIWALRTKVLPFHAEQALDGKHQHLPTAMGALHGLAGSAPVLALIPITLLDNFSQAVLYLVFFSVGTTLSMSVYALLAAAAIQGLRLPADRIRQLTMAISLVTIATGLWWLTSAVAG